MIDPTWVKHLKPPRQDAVVQTWQEQSPDNDGLDDPEQAGEDTNECVVEKPHECEDEENTPETNVGKP